MNDSASDREVQIVSLCVDSKCVSNEDLPDAEGSDVDCDYSDTHLLREAAALDPRSGSLVD